MLHHPVLTDRVVHWFGDIEEGVIIDGTFGAGGHTKALLQATPESVSIIGLDRDPSAVSLFEENAKEFGDRVSVMNGSFSSCDQVRSKIGSRKVMGFLMDLGVSSIQLDSRGRGFSFRDDDSLDMRFNPENGGASAADVVNTFKQVELESIFREFGEVRFSRRIARAICHHRITAPFRTGKDLADCIASAVPPNPKKHIHPATQSFQAIRIFVNSELDHLAAGLESAVTILAPTGRLVVISFHSLEDRMVKQFMIRKSGKCQCPDDFPVCVCHPVQQLRIKTRRPEGPGTDEIQMNPRARSSRLRCAEKTEVME
jgi:16S rRNA (cytosine1402-N4)-methyltransferase